MQHARLNEASVDVIHRSGIEHVMIDAGNSCWRVH